jgi:DNA-binding NtrC family response regulator
MATLLYVDDDPSLRIIVRRQLELFGLQVLTAESVAEAKERIEQGSPDGVFIDIWLGDGTAFDLFAWMQEHHPVLVRRVAFVTGDVAEGVPPEKALSALGCPVFAKPFDIPAMAQLASSWGML